MDKEEVKVEILSRVKVTHNIKGNEFDLYINQLTSNAVDEFLIHAGLEDRIDERLLFVIEGVVNRRYVRRREEGIESIKSSNVWVTYLEDKGDFEGYLPIIKTYYGNGTRQVRRVVFK